jgi:hypothetical protein
MYDMLIVEFNEHEPLGLSYIGKKLVRSCVGTNVELLPFNPESKVPI